MNENDLVNRASNDKSSEFERTYPLTPMQQGMLYNSISRSNSGIDIEQLVCTLREDLDSPCFFRAWLWVTGRHHALRASFHWEGLAEPVQVFNDTVEIDIYEQDWRGVSEQEQNVKLADYLAHDRLRGFDLTHPPLQRLACFHMAAEHVVVIWTFHHIILDGRAFPIVIQEVFAAYEAMRQGIEPVLGMPESYPKFLEDLARQDASLAESFWRDQLGDFRTPTQLFVDHGIGQQSGDRSIRESTYFEQETRLSESLASTLGALARQYDVTVNNMVQAAWAILLSRYSLEEDVVFGTTRACRHSTLPGAENTVGLFTNTVPMRVRLPADMRLLDLLKDLHARQVSFRSVEHTPLVVAHGWSGVPRNLPLFDTLVAFEGYSLNEVLRATGDGWQLRDFQVLDQTGFPLTLNVTHGSELVLRICSDTDRFDEFVVSRMLGHLRTLLEGIAADPHRRLSDLPMLTDAERHQVLVEWNDTKREYPRDKCVHQLFEEQVQITPDAVAVVFEDQKLTYGEMNRKSNQMAHHLRKLGVGPDVLVGICLERSLEMVVGLLAILKAGGAYVPLDPAYPQERLSFMLEDTKAPVLLTQQCLVSNLPACGAQFVCLDRDWDSIAQEAPNNPVSGVAPRDLAYVIFTSGSTGKPKGVAMPHLPLVNLIEWQRHQSGTGPGQRTLQFTTLSFDVAFQEIFATWCVGGTLVLISEKVRRDLASLPAVLAAQSIDRLFLPFVALQHLAEACCLQESFPRCLKEIITAGEQLQITPTISRLLGQITGCILYNQYGPTESHVVTAVSLVPPLDRWSRLPPIGQPIANSQVYVLDQGLQLVPVGLPGELYLGGDCLARGYLNRPELTAQRFIAHPFGEEGARLYRTGDLARYLHDGNIEFLGRMDHQVKIRGFRIELGEIEAVLGQHGGMKQSVVIAREDTPGDKRLVAYCIPTDAKSQPAVEDLRSFLKQKLPEYMIPSAFVVLQEMPLTPNGKIDRKALPMPDQSRQEMKQVYLAPRNPIEEMLAGIFQEVLKLDHVGVQDNFFDLGGHSLLAMRVISQIQQDLHIELPVWTLFDHPCIEELAADIGQSERFADIGVPQTKAAHPWASSDIKPEPAGVLRDFDMVLGNAACDHSREAPRESQATGTHAVYRFLALSDHWVARAARWLRRSSQQVSVPAPRIVVRPLLWAFLAGRAIYFFLKRVLICEPLFKAYCTRYGSHLHTGVFVHWIQGAGNIIIGNDVSLDGKCSISFAARFVERPTLIIGDHSALGHGCSLTIGKRITIGRHCRIAGGVWMFDSSGHPVDPEARKAGKPPSADEVFPITIGDNVWIGQHSTILPGVTVGENSIVSAHSVVMTDVPPNTVVAGNPARTVSRIGRLATAE